MLAKQERKNQEANERTRGGRRTGAGRPVGTVKTGAGNPENKFQIRLDTEAAQWLKGAGGNAFLNDLVMDRFRDAKKPPT